MGPEIALALTAASTVMGAVGSFQQGQAASQQADYTAQVARNNATIERQNAEYATQVGEVQAQAQGLRNRAVLGSVIASQGASGLSLDSPSLRDVRAGTEQIGLLDTATLYNNALVKARANEAKAMNYEAEAGLQKAKSSNASTTAAFNIGSTLLSGASSFSDKWMRYQKEGIKGF